MTRIVRSLDVPSRSRKHRLIAALLTLGGALVALVVGPGPARAQESQTPPAVGGSGQPLAVDPDAAERALERILVLRGQLLLPFGQFEIEPSIGYEHTDRGSGVAITFVDADGDGVSDDPVPDTLRARRDRTTAALEARVGLPFESQFEFRLPLAYVHEQVDQPIAGVSRSESTSGLGDIRVGVAKTLLRENGGVPDVIGRIAWDTASGEDSETLSVTSGYDEIIGSLSAIKRIDPLVLTGGAAYQWSFERDDVKPGDMFGFNVGTTLATSPSTALSFGFSASFRRETEVNGVEIQASDLNEAYLSFGLGTVIRRNTLLSVNFGTGLTEDSTDYFISASLPIRFTAW